MIANYKKKRKRPSGRRKKRNVRSKKKLRVNSKRSKKKKKRRLLKPRRRKNESSSQRRNALEVLHLRAPRVARLAVPIPVGRPTARIPADLHTAAVVVPVDLPTAGMIAAVEGAAVPEVPHRRPIPVTAAGLVLPVTDDPSVAVPVDLIHLLPKRFGLLRRRTRTYQLEALDEKKGKRSYRWPTRQQQFEKVAFQICLPRQGSQKGLQVVTFKAQPFSLVFFFLLAVE